MSDISVVPNAALTSLIEDSKTFAVASRAEGTVRQYTSNWRGFLAFCEQHNLPTLPTNVPTVCVYLTSMAKAGRSVSTITAHLAAIKYFHDQARVSLNWEDPAIAQIMGGIRRTCGKPVNKASAVLADDLRKLIDGCSTRDKAIILIGFAGAMRRSEITGMTVENLEFVDEGLLILIPRSKTDQNGNGHEVAIPYASDVDMCPVRALQKFLKDADIRSGPVFRSVDRFGRIAAEAMSEESIRRILAKATERAGVEGKISPHSLRAGFCTQAALNGSDMVRIADHARHASIQTTMGYVRVASRFKNHAGKGML